jgi:hypothetical protein
MNTLHPSHRTRFSFDASTFDEICKLCGATDMVPGGWGNLAKPCPASEEERQEYDRKEMEKK